MSITLPRYVRTPAEFYATVQRGVTSESEVLEFKGVLYEEGKEIARSVAPFANTIGGCLLIGVPWRTADNGLKVADGVKSVADPEQARDKIERAIANHLVPSTFSHDVTPVQLTEGMIIAVNVPPSVHLVSLWDRQAHTVEYLYRTSHGKEWMNPDEAERHLMNTSRSAKLNVLAVCDRAPQRRDVEIVRGFWVWSSQYPLGPPQRLPTPNVVRMGEMGEDTFDLQVTIGTTPRTLTLPYGAVKEAWFGGGAKVVLLLSVRPILRDETLTVNPH